MAFIAGCNFFVREPEQRLWPALLLGVTSALECTVRQARLESTWIPLLYIRKALKISLAPLQSSEKRQVVVCENGAGYFEVRFEGWKKGKSPIEWGRRKIGEAHDRDEEGSIKSPVLARGVEKAG